MLYNSRNFNQFDRNFYDIFLGEFNLIESLFSCFIFVVVRIRVKLRNLKKIRGNKDPKKFIFHSKEQK